MGDEVLKKQIFFTIFFILISNTFLMSSERGIEKTKEFNKFFQDISKKRVGASEQDVNKVKNPFIMISNKGISIDGNVTVTQEIVYTLSGIFDKKAKINGKWYRLSSKIGDFKLIKIKNKSVIIKNEHSKQELFIRKNNVDKITFSSK